MSNRNIPELPKEVSSIMKEIGERLTAHRQQVGSNYKKFAAEHGINNMTLWRMEAGEDYKMSSFLQVLNEIGITPEDFFKGVK